MDWEQLLSTAGHVVKHNKRRKYAEQLVEKYGESPDAVVERSGALYDLIAALEKLEQLVTTE